MYPCFLDPEKRHAKKLDEEILKLNLEPENKKFGPFQIGGPKVPYGIRSAIKLWKGPPFIPMLARPWQTCWS
jgi:hypothetical protein